MKVLSFLTVVALVVLDAAAASAQASRPERPFRGLFGSGVVDAQQLLTVSGSLGGGWDTNIFADALGQPLTSGPQQPGTVGTGSGSLSYVLTRGRVSANASAGTSLRYYPSRSNDIVRSYNGSAGVSAALLTRPAVSVSQSVSYQPTTFSALFPTFSEVVGGSENEMVMDLEVMPVREHFVSYSGGASLSQRISRRTSLSANYGYRLSDGLFGRRFFTQSAGGGLRTELTGGLSLRLGYAYSEGRYGDEDVRARDHAINVGVDYSRALSFSRRTSLSFGTGSSASVHDGRTQFRASGNVRLNHEIGRTWNASIGYSRGLRFVETLNQPVFSDALTSRVGGLITRRLQFQASGRAAVGAIGNSGDNGFDTYRGSAGLSFALNRYISTSMDYSYYRNAFGSSVVLPAGFAQDVGRQSIRANVNVWAPLFQQRSR